MANVISPQLLPAAASPGAGRHLLLLATATPTYTYHSFSPTVAGTGDVSNSTACTQTTNGCPLPGYNASYSQCTRCQSDANCHSTHYCDTCQSRCIPRTTSTQAAFASCLCVGGAGICTSTSTASNNVRLAAGAFPTSDPGCGIPAKQCVACPVTYLA